MLQAVLERVRAPISALAHSEQAAKLGDELDAFVRGFDVFTGLRDAQVLVRLFQ